MPAITERTITNIEKFERQVEKILTDGFAVENQELRKGVIRVASPIYDHEHQLAGCLSVAAPIFSFEGRPIDQIGKKVKEISQRISRELGDG